MIVGDNHLRLEKRIAAALLSGIPYPREAYFLQQMSMQILRHGQNARLSERQGAWLFAILRRHEADTASKPCLAPRRPQQDKPKAKPAKPVLMRDCLDVPDLMQHSVQHIETAEAAEPGNGNEAPMTALTRPELMIDTRTPTEPPAARPELDFGSTLTRIVLKNQLLRQRRERMERSRRPSAHIPNKA